MHKNYGSSTPSSSGIERKRPRFDFDADMPVEAPFEGLSLADMQYVCERWSEVFTTIRDLLGIGSKS
jgi:hypothetical protein